jgi:predicted N-acetyltransferase YhbS
MSQPVRPQQLGFLVVKIQYDGYGIGDALYELSASHTPGGLYEHN